MRDAKLTVSELRALAYDMTCSYVPKKSSIEMLALAEKAAAESADNE